MNSEVIAKVKAKAAAIRYRHPARGLRIIAVAGAYGKTTTALLLSEILQEAGQSVLVLTNRGCYYDGSPQELGYDTSAQALQRCLQLARNKRVQTVIVEITDKLLESHVLSTLTIDMSIITSNSPGARDVMNQPVTYTVLPSGLDIGSLTVSPHQAINFGEDEVADARLAGVRLYKRGTEAEIVVDHQTKLTLSTHLVGTANALNVATAVAAAYMLAVDTTLLEEGVARLERVVGNYDYIDTKELYTIITDAATSIRSLELVLEAATKLKKRRLLIALDDSVDDAGYDAAKRASERLIVVGKGSDYTAGITFVNSIAEAVSVTLRGAKKDDLVVFIGKRFTHSEYGDITAVQHVLEAPSE